MLHVLSHPPALVNVTVYVPALVTVIHWLVEPVFQEYELNPAGAHIIVDPPRQKKPFPVMEQAAGLLIVENAGGIVSDFKGNHDFSAGEVVASNKLIAESILKGVTLM